MLANVNRYRSMDLQTAKDKLRERKSRHRLSPCRLYLFYNILTKGQGIRG